jgi:hypothetical protein
LNPSDVLDWLGVSEIVILRPDAEMEIEVEVHGDPAWQTTPDWRGFQVPQELILETPNRERRVSPAEAWRLVADEGVWRGVPTDGSRQTLAAVFPMKGTESKRLVMETPFGRALVRVLRFEGELWFEREVVPVERATRYLGPDGVIARSAHFSFDEGNQRLRVVLHVIDGTLHGHHSFSLRLRNAAIERPPHSRVPHRRKSGQAWRNACVSFSYQDAGRLNSSQVQPVEAADGWLGLSKEC